MPTATKRCTTLLGCRGKVRSGVVLCSEGLVGDSLRFGQALFRGAGGLVCCVASVRLLARWVVGDGWSGMLLKTHHCCAFVPRFLAVPRLRKSDRRGRWRAHPVPGAGVGAAVAGSVVVLVAVTVLAVQPACAAAVVVVVMVVCVRVGVGCFRCGGVGLPGVRSLPYPGGRTSVRTEVVTVARAWRFRCDFPAHFLRHPGADRGARYGNGRALSNRRF